MTRFAKSFVLFLSCAALLAGLAYAPAVLAVTCTSTAAGGNWNLVGTWTGCAGGNGVPANTPGTNDTAIIATTGASFVTLNAAETVVAVTVNANAFLTQSSSLTTTGALNVAGTMTSTNTMAIGGATSITGTLNITSVTGTRTFTGAVTITGGTWNNSINEPVTVQGGLTNNGGTFTAGTGVYTFSTNAQVIGGTSPITIPNVTVTAIALTNNGTLTASTTLAGSGSLINSATGTLNIGGTSAITTLTATAAGNTVNYTGAAQTVKATAYSNLGLSGSGIKTLTGVTTVGGNLTLSGTATATTAAALAIGGNLNVGVGTTLTVGAFNIGVTGTTSVSGILAHSSATGTKTYTGAVTINAGGSLTNAGNAAITYAAGLVNSGSFASGTGAQTFTNGGLTHNGTSFTAGTGAFIFSTNAQAINCASPLAIPSITVTAVTATNNCNLTVNTALAGTGNLTNAATGTLNITFAGPPGITTLTATAVGNTVNYTGAAQTVKATAYHHLGLSGSGAKTMTGVTTIGGNLTMSGTATATAAAALTVGGDFTIGASNTFANGTFALNVAGNFAQNGTFTAGSGVVTLNGGAAVQTISGVGALGFANLTVNNTGGITLARNVTVTSAIVGVVTLTSTCPTDFTLTSNGGVTVAHSCPPTSVVNSINCAVSCAATSAATVSWTVTFNKSVTGVDASAFALAPSGLSGAYIATVTGIGTTWTVSANTGIGIGTLGLNQTGPGSVSPTLTGTFTGQVYTISATPALAEYRMDEANWNGTVGEVVDSSGSYPGRAVNSANTTDGVRAIAANPGTCRFGVFDNGSTITQGYVELPGFPNLNTDFTITAWIRTTDNTVAAQRILIDDESNTGGYGLSLGDGGTGVVRFFARGSSAIILDTPLNTIASNTWYFVAGVADITNGIRKIYVYDALGNLLPGLPVSVASTGWGTDAGMASIGAETNASGELPAANHFKGNLDEVRVYQKALNQSAVTALATQTHTCALVIAVPNHYELSLPTNSVACLATTVTVTACTDATSPCTNLFAAASGTTAILATSGGTLGVTPVTFGATGVASTTLSYPAAPDGTPAVVTLSGEQSAASNPRQCCPNGTSCVVANNCSTTFNTAGFIFSAGVGGGVATIPTQVAGVTSAANYLRAVKTSTTTQACEAALTGTSAVNFAYECNNPTSCYTSNLMSVNGGTATTIARNNNGSVASYLPVNMTFDANGNAPFTFNYSDAGQVKLWASKTASGALLSTLTGSSNSFVVKPHHFDITNIACATLGAGTCASANVTGNNPAASGAAGAAFIQAGQPFKATVTAMNGAATPAFTPNFGKETPAEGAELTSFNHLPGLGGATAISRVLSGFNSGAATLTDLAWNEVGVLQLRATLSNANGYLGSDSVNGKNAVVSAANPYVGRFISDHFDTVVTPQGGGFAYSGNPVGPVPGQPFTVTVTAKNASASPTANYYNAGGYARNVNLSVPVGGATGQLYIDAVAGGTGAVPAVKFLNLNPGEGKVNYSDATGKISFVFNSLPYYLAAPIQIHAEDADTVTSSGANGNINIRHGRLRVFNAFGSEKADLSLPLRAEYWTGNSWVLNSADSFTVIPAGSIALSGYSGTLSAANLGVSHVTGTTLAGGQGSIVLLMPSPTATGSVDLAINLGAGAADQSCLASHPATTGAAIPWLRSIYGNCAITYDRDPSARGSLGIYAPETKRTIHVRELF
jgi:MSHA biogenesis protein MshQ